MYSVGIHTSWGWESKLAAQYPCEVHAFDPTQNHPALLPPPPGGGAVHFHKLGLAAGTAHDGSNSVHYTSIDTSLLLPLDKLQERLGHAGRRISLLMLDCEGCEFRLFVDR